MNCPNCNSLDLKWLENRNVTGIYWMLFIMPLPFQEREANLYCCNDCGAIFEKGERAVVDETDGFYGCVVDYKKVLHEGRKNESK